MENKAEEHTGSSFPARWWPACRGEEGKKHEGDEGNLWTCSVWVGMAGKGIPLGEQRVTATASCGGGAPEALGGSERAGELHYGNRMRCPGSFGVEEDRRWRLRCAVGAAAMAGGGELDSGELEAGAAVGELLRDEAKQVRWPARA